MCPHCEDFARTVEMLAALALYSHVDGADIAFIDAMGPSLVASLPAPPPGTFPPGYNPDDGPQYPGQG
ncbi:hypothetical protein QF037_004919 [Streptomyces canus]|uniref:hypothetical protein n=1 Tax=Streptomyces canus TaxID=58343 RepID=UPI00278A8033|nr:hypothetical protein [Streptomyces canus]MDQ0600574.1 hypothetical protein [Streptomyces canus]